MGKIDMRASHRIPRAAVFLAMFLCSLVVRVAGQDAQELKKEIDELREQNRLLQQQLQQQRQMIDQLSGKVSGLQQTNEQSQSDLRALKATVENAPSLPEKSKGFGLGNVIISGEGAAGYLDTQNAGKYPKGTFLVDEARLFVDAPLWEDVYFYGQVDLQTREEYDLGVYLGELYIQWENLGKYWNHDESLNARLGQFYTPFGEEYQSRFAIDNALIYHSLSDVWGLDPGLELYGTWKPLSYVVAVQNGGMNTLNSSDGDKMVAGRLGFDPVPWLHFSASGLRTGHLSVANDTISGLWFGGGFFSPIGKPATTTVFQANMAEADAQAKWNGGYLRLAGGYADYDDNNTAAADHRDIYYYYAEALQHLAPKFYGVMRWSQIITPNGYPIAGDTTAYPFLPTSDMWRLSLGLGYRFNEHLLLKIEYAFEQGRLSTGGFRDHENLFGAEAAFKF
jgi:FtsZ-binding cell division protein ZapB